jgi:hypothetical protein
VDLAVPAAACGYAAGRGQSPARAERLGRFARFGPAAVTAEFKRLGKRGSYRLGQLRAQGIGAYQRPVPYQPRFVRQDHRWPASVWVLGLLTGSLVVAGAAAAGWWFVPFLVGVLAGVANWIGAWRLRVALPAVAVMAAVGWAAPLALSVLRGQPYVAMARVIATGLGLPEHATAAIALTVLVAVAQALAGYWLGRALAPRPAADLLLAMPAGRAAPHQDVASVG